MRRLMDALNAAGVDTRMPTLERREPHERVHRVVGRWRARWPFLLERLQIFLSNGRNRRDLFKADTATFGLPLHRDPLIAEADVVILGWVNQGMISLREIERIADAGKPIYWVMHDMWCMTGICHHAGSCDGFRGECGLCPLLGRKASPRDLSHRIWRRKRRFNSRVPVTYIAVSRWLAGRARDSSLLRDARLEVIGNPIEVPPLRVRNLRGTGLKVLIAAARLDDPIKGLPILKDAAARLKLANPALAGRLEFIACGALKDPEALKDFPLPIDYRGPQDLAGMEEAYREAHIVVSSSLYETLPGTLVEGQIYGAVPVAFDRGGQRDIIDDGLTGILCPFGGADHTEASENLAQGIERAATLIAADYETLQRRMHASVEARFSPQAIAAAWLRLLG